MIFAIFDTETTGLTLHPHAPLARQPQMIEFGGVLFGSELGIIEQLSFLVNPGCPLPEEIVKITGLTDADLATAPAFVAMWPRLAEFFGKADVVVAHNLPFDRTILFGELERAKRAEGFPWPDVELCTVQLYRDEWGRNPKLTELYALKMGRPLAQTHRALDDVLALTEIVEKERVWDYLS